MENNRSEAGWEGLKEYLREQIAGAEDQQGLADEQRAIINQMILEPLERAPEALEKADRETMGFLLVPFVAFIMVGWLKLGFLPSQLKSWMEELGGLELSATFFRMFPRIKAGNAPAPSGVSQFWDGIICKEMYTWEDAKNAFDLCLNDPSLPPWMRVTALQLKVWHHVWLQEYDTARQTLEQLRDNLSVSKPKVDYLMGYIKALEDSGRGSIHYELHHDDTLIMVPEARPGELQFLPEEATKTGALAEGVSLAESTIEALKLAITERIEPRLLLAIWHAKEEIIGSMPITHTLEEVSQRLRDKHGDWVSKLANQGALTNAEFLYEALKAKSWGGVITEYANAVEAEIKAKLLPGLGNLLKKNGTTLENILPSRVESGGSSLGYAEVVLKRIAANQLLTNFLSALPKDTVSFLLYELPGSLAKLRELRNPAPHGNVMTASQAKEMQKLVLGTPEKPGLLKRLNDINISLYGIAGRGFAT